MDNKVENLKREVTALSKEDLQELLNGMARILKEPTDEEKRKREEEQAKAIEQRNQMIQEAATIEKSRHDQVMACARNGHKKQDGTTAIYGQPHSDGKFHPICIVCHATGDEDPALKPFPTPIHMTI
jgi:hypothetical protein